uniref:Dephospho-CoA kinase n=1 Tax=Nelumbo nucifera TaxID=4432 RepID=A0A822YLD2_NELNU|nr:TPA_asm: hypothetical protein HUJ06_012183 [Nelumbo nucifera]
MRIVGLTGGIASGKSTVSNLFKGKGIPVVDADLVAREVLQKGTGGWKRVVAAFGEDILLGNGEVDRARLGQIVFSDPAKRQLLNRSETFVFNLTQVTGSFISSGIFWEIVKLWMKGSEVIVLDVPLLFEAKMDRWTKPIIVVWINPETQLQRLIMGWNIGRKQKKMLSHKTNHVIKVFVQVTRPLTWKDLGCRMVPLGYRFYSCSCCCVQAIYSSIDGIAKVSKRVIRWKEEQIDFAHYLL